MKKIKILFLCLIMCLSFSSFKNTDDSINFVIENIDSQKNPIKGFEYEIFNQTKDRKSVINMKNKSKETVKLEKGEYVIKEKTTANGFIKSKDFLFTVDDKTPKTVKYFPKHIAIVKENKTNKKTPKDNKKINQDQEKTTNTKKTNKYAKTNISNFGFIIPLVLGMGMVITPLVFGKRKFRYEK